MSRHGSVGASGDLVQLAHIALALIGEAEVSFRGETVPATEAMAACGIAPLRLRIRDGLAAAGIRVKDRKDGSDWELE